MSVHAGPGPVLLYAARNGGPQRQSSRGMCVREGPLAYRPIDRPVDSLLQQQRFGGVCTAVRRARCSNCRGQVCIWVVPLPYGQNLAYPIARENLCQISRTQADAVRPRPKLSAWGVSFLSFNSPPAGIRIPPSFSKTRGGRGTANFEPEGPGAPPRMPRRCTSTGKRAESGAWHAMRAHACSRLLV